MSYTNGTPPSVRTHAEGQKCNTANGIIPLDKSFLFPDLRYLPLEGKNPAINGHGWNTPERVQELDAKVRNGWRGNIGVYLGALGGDLVDVDFDLAKSYPHPDRLPALTKVAREVFPQTGMAWGRDPSALGHLVYRVADIENLALMRIALPGSNKPLLELRVEGQSLYDGVHPETGKPVHHFSRGEPAEVWSAELARAFGFFGAVVLVSLIWESGSRHNCSVPLAGYLLRQGFSKAEAQELLKQVCLITGDKERSTRLADVLTTARRLNREQTVVGLPTLLKVLPQAKLHALGCTAEAWAEAFTAAVQLALGKSVEADADTDADPDDPEKARAAASKRLYEAARNQVVEAFRDSSGVRYLTVDFGDHYETFRLQSTDCREWLTRFCKQLGVVPRDATLDEVQLYLAADATDTQEVCLRVGGESGVLDYTYTDPLTGQTFTLPPRTGKIYLDLGQPDWTIVEITPEGWRLIPYKECPVRFVRMRHTSPLPVPERVEASEVHRLRRYFRATDATYPLLLMWVLGAFKPDSPYPILYLHGQQGSGKSTTTRLLRALIDPASFDHSSEPRSLDDLFVQATKAHLMAFDNLSHLSRELSDGLCRLATGGGLLKRELYTNGELVALTARRPIILNAIAEIVNASDLADRMLDVELVPIASAERLTENAFWNSFRHEHPRILGAILEGLVRAMRDWVHLQLSELPRMADFALWVCAGMQAYGYTPEQALALLMGNKQDVNTALVERNPLAQAIVELMRDRDQWEGTPSDLLSALRYAVGEPAARALPRSSHTLGKRLSEVEAPLQTVHIGIERVKSNQRLIRIFRGNPTCETQKPTPTSNDESSNRPPIVQDLPPENEFKTGVLDDSDDSDDSLQVSLQKTPPETSTQQPPSEPPRDETEQLRQYIRQWMETHEPFGVRIGNTPIPASLWKHAVKYANLEQLREWAAQLTE